VIGLITNRVKWANGVSQCSLKETPLGGIWLVGQLKLGQILFENCIDMNLIEANLGFI